jgi:hypothetical protein
MTQITLVMILLLATAAHGGAQNERDGAVIHNSGSTNTRGYAIKVWSDGSAQLEMNDQSSRPVTLESDVTVRFFDDLRSARANPGTPQHCMKSASFGTTTTVAWHDYTSVDLQCPPLTPAVAALASDVRAIAASANADTHVHRLPLPGGMRMIPSPSPEVSPT